MEKLICLNQKELTAKTEAKAATRTSPRISFETGFQASQRKGLTLLEIVIVVALITILTVIALPGLSGFFRVSLETTTREIASKAQEAYHSSIITGRIQRLAYDIDKGQYWVEVGPENLILESEDSRRLAEDRRSSKSEKAEKKSPFSLDSTINRKKQSLPDGVKFDKIHTEGGKDPITSAIAYTHFFPHGLSELTLLKLVGPDDQTLSLVLEPTLGKARNEPGNITWEAAFEK